MAQSLGEKVTSFSAYTEVHKILLKNSKEIKKLYRLFISFQFLRHQAGLPETTQFANGSTLHKGPSNMYHAQN